MSDTTFRLSAEKRQALPPGSSEAGIDPGGGLPPVKTTSREGSRRRLHPDAGLPGNGRTPLMRRDDGVLADAFASNTVVRDDASADPATAFGSLWPAGTRFRNVSDPFDDKAEPLDRDGNPTGATRERWADTEGLCGRDMIAFDGKSYSLGGRKGRGELKAATESMLQRLP